MDMTIPAKITTAGSGFPWVVSARDARGEMLSGADAAKQDYASQIRSMRRLDGMAGSLHNNTRGGRPVRTGTRFNPASHRLSDTTGIVNIGGGCRQQSGLKQVAKPPAALPSSAQQTTWGNLKGWFDDSL